MTKKTSSLKSKRSSQGQKRRRPWWRPSSRLLGTLALGGAIIFIVWLGHLNDVVTKTFNGKKWAIPAKVYAQPVELYEGMSLDPDQLHEQLHRQGYQPVERPDSPGLFSRNGNTFEIYVRGFQFPDGTRNAVKLRATFSGNHLQRLTTTDGKNIPVIRLDPQLMGGIYPASFEDRTLARLPDVPETLLEALVTVEDRDFYEHWGISPKGIARAMAVNIKAGAIVQGGSTLTQQLVKNFYLSNQRTFARKIEEAFMSLLLEWHHTKDEILETYLNEVYLGQQGRRSVNGFALASEFYFARPLSELNLARQALLVAMVKGPSWYNPRRYPERAKARRDLVLDMMADQGTISQVDADKAKGYPLGVVSTERLHANAFPAYIDLVKRQLRQDYDNADLTSEGLRIFTHMNPIVQQQAQASVSRLTKQLDGGKDTGLEAAMVVTSARTGEVQAVVGGRDAGFAGFNRALDANRPIGSLVKPAVYLTALLQPERYTLATPLSDESLTLTESNGKDWSPQNYDKKSHGEVPLYMALAKSYNQATARLGIDVGLSSVIETLKDMGMVRNVAKYPSLLLGSIDFSPIEVAAMYQTLASGGYRVPLRAIDAVLDAYGQPLTQYSLSVEEAFPASSVELVNHAMQTTMSEGTGKAAYQKIPLSIKVAGKTGTTDELRDSWFAGFSADTLAVTWLGRDDNTATRYTGSSGALRIWSDFMSQRPLQSLEPPLSSDIAFYDIDRTTGMLGGTGCRNEITLPFIKGSEPLQYAPCVVRSQVVSRPQVQDRQDRQDRSVLIDDAVELIKTFKAVWDWMK